MWYPLGRFGAKIADLNWLDHDLVQILRGAVRDGPGGKMRRFGRERAGYGLDFAFLVHPGLTGSRSGPEVWARRWAQFAPFVNYMEGVKVSGLEIAPEIKAGVDSVEVGYERKLYFVRSRRASRVIPEGAATYR